MAENPHAIIGIFGDEASEDSAGRGNSETSQNRILKNQRKMQTNVIALYKKSHMSAYFKR